MAGNSLRFSVEVAADQATQALNVLSQSFNQAGISAKSALLGIGSGSKAANDAVGGFEGKLKSLKSEMASGDRTINFFARSLNGIVPEASAAGQGLRLLADGLIGGIGLGFALQGVMAVLTLFGDKLKESAEAERKAREETERHAASLDKATAAWRDYAVAAQGGEVSGAGMKYMKERTAAQDALNAALVKQIDLQADLDAGPRTNESSVGWSGFPGIKKGRKAEIQEQLEGVTTEVERAREALARLEEDYNRIGAPADAAAKIGKDNAAADKAAGPADKKAEEAARKAYEEETRRMVERAKLAEQIAADEANARGEIENFAAAAAERQRQRAEDLAAWWKDFNEQVAETEARMAEEASKNAQAAIQPFVDAFTAGISEMVAGTKSFGAALRGMVAGIIQAALKAIMAHALESGALAFKSQAGTPVVGPALGAAAMAAAVAAVMGLMGRMPSAEGGWLVPKGIDPITQLHAGERVIPAKYADGLDRLVEGGGRAAPVFNITTPDAESFYRMLKNRDSELFKVLNEGMRDRRFG